MARKRKGLTVAETNRYVAGFVCEYGAVNLDGDDWDDPLLAEYVPTRREHPVYGKHVAHYYDVTEPARREIRRELLETIGQKVTHDTMAELDSYEIHALYGLDTYPQLNQEFTWQYHTRKERGETDVDELARQLPEFIREQLATSFRSYRQVAEALGVDAVDAFDFEHFFGLKDSAWQENGVYRHVASEFLRSQKTFTLVATPNVPYGVDDVINIAQKISEEKGYGFGVNRDMFDSKHYSDRLWAGVRGDELIRWSLIPSPDWRERYTPGNWAKHVKDMQKKYPELNLRSPNVIEALVHWQNVEKHQDRLGFAHYSMGFVQPDARDTHGAYFRNACPVTIIDNYRRNVWLGSATKNQQELGVIALG